MFLNSFCTDQGNQQIPRVNLPPFVVRCLTAVSDNVPLKGFRTFRLCNIGSLNGHFQSPFCPQKFEGEEKISTYL
ncbi:hypothetical protein BH10CYA1_BH10CYA1_54110 [soil metagenome]